MTHHVFGSTAASIVSLGSTSSLVALEESKIERENELHGLFYIIRFFVRAHNPLTRQGLQRIKKTFLASGAAASRFTQANQERRLRRYSGWRFGSFIACWEVGICLTLNLIFLVCALSASYPSNGIGTLYEGSCAKVKNLDSCLHVLINGLATALIGASNYNMQCLASPNREEINIAHAKGVWLDIGTPSVRNLRHISWKRVLLWALLAASSVPLHLLWNSTIFSTLQNNNYVAMTVSEDFLADRSPDCEWQFASNYTSFLSIVCDMYAAAQEDIDSKTRLTRLNVDECVQAYGNPIQSRWTNVIAVSNSAEHKPSTIFNVTSLEDVVDGAYSRWICDGSSRHRCNYSPFAEDIAYNPPTISHCLAASAPESCTLQYSLTIVVIVVIANAIKLLAMLGTLRVIKDQHFITIGDAIASFLDETDCHTVGICLTAKADCKRSFNKPSRLELTVDQTKSLRWFHAPSKARWLVCMLLYCSALIAAGTLYYVGAIYIEGDQTTWSLGFGTVSEDSLINYPFYGYPASTVLLRMVLLANTPQLVLSMLYFTYNGLYTSMLAASEWSRFVRHRKALRVTSPVREQRSTYWLQLPWTYAIPLGVVSSVLHWLVSESIFLVSIKTYDPYHQVTESEWTTTNGYSTYAVMIVIVVGSVMVLALILNGFRKLDPGMPLAGSCSLAISAACHQPYNDFDARLLPLKWGATSHETGNRPGHCCFTSFEVEEPIVGQRYA